MPLDSVSRRLNRVRPPHVHITYDVEIGGAIEKREIPFVVGVLADLSAAGGPGQALRDRRFIEVDRDNFDSVMGKIGPELSLDVPNRLSADQPRLFVRLRLTRMASFEPEEVVSQIAPLKQLLIFRRNLRALSVRMIGDVRFEEELENAFQSAKPAAARDIVGYLARKTSEFAADASDGAFLNETIAAQLSANRSVEWDVPRAIDECIAAVDALVSRQLNEVMHAPEFQRLEATWRGLSYLVNQTESSSKLKIRLLDATKGDLLHDLGRAVEVEKAAIFQKVFTEEYGTLGGQPFGLLVGDYEFGPSAEDVTILDQLSRIGAFIHAPFISSASPAMFGFTSFDELAGPRDLASVFEDARFLRWRSFRQSDDARYVGLCVPHILLRLPYGYDAPVEQFQFDEMIDGRTREKYVWGNTAYALAARITDAFARYEWCAAIRGVEGGGRVEGLPAHAFRTDDGEIERKSQTDLAITDRREVELSRLGFIPLCHYKGTDMAVFFGVPSVQQPKQYHHESANASARLSGQIHYLLAVSRFAHFMTVLMRDKVGSFLSREECERFLNFWISNYVLLDDSATQETKAQFPLREARIDVSEIPGKPGAYVATAFLRPHFQLDELSISLRVTVRLSWTGA
jgi:type VI secretion system protein ImpC